MTIDSVRMRFTVPEKKLLKLEVMATSIMKKLRSNRRQVDTAVLRSFAGVCQSLSLAVPETRFRLSELYTAIASSKKRTATLRGQQSRRFCDGGQYGTTSTPNAYPQEPIVASTIHTDSSTTGRGAILSRSLDRPGQPGSYEVSGY